MASKIGKLKIRSINDGSWMDFGEVVVSESWGRGLVDRKAFELRVPTLVRSFSFQSWNEAIERGEQYAQDKQCQIDWQDIEFTSKIADFENAEGETLRVSIDLAFKGWYLNKKVGILSTYPLFGMDDRKFFPTHLDAESFLRTQGFNQQSDWEYA